MQLITIEMFRVENLVHLAVLLPRCVEETCLNRHLKLLEKDEDQMYLLWMRVNAYNYLYTLTCTFIMICMCVKYIMEPDVCLIM